MATPIGFGSASVMTKVQQGAGSAGLIPKSGLKEVKKEEEHTTTIQELEEQDTSNKTSRSSQDTRGAQSNQQQQAPEAKVRQRQISPAYERPAQSEETSEATTTEQASERSSLRDGQSTGSYVKLDTTAQTAWRFNQMKAQQRAGDSASGAPPQTKSAFLARFHQRVKDELAQYTKSNDGTDSNPYSRKNLRDILAALPDPNTDFLAKKYDTANKSKPGQRDEAYNKFNQMRAEKSLKVVQERHDESQEQGQLLQLVA